MIIKKMGKSEYYKANDLLKKRIFTDGQKASFYWPEEAFREEFLMGIPIGGWLNENDGDLVSLAILRLLGDVVEITMFFIDPDFGRRGLSESFLKKLTMKNDATWKSQAALDDILIREWWLEVHEDNLAAIKLYEKCGFKVCGIRKKYYQDLKSALLMKLVTS